MPQSGQVVFSRMEEVQFGKPAAEMVADLVKRQQAERVFLMVSGTLNRDTDEIDKLRRALGNKCVGGGGDHPSGRRPRRPGPDRPQRDSHAATPLVRMPLPSLVGSGPPWLHACQEVETIFRSGEWLAVEGEPGVGELAVLRAVQLRRQPVARFEVLEARDAATESDWLQSVRTTLSSAESVVTATSSLQPRPGPEPLATTLQEARQRVDAAVGRGHALQSPAGHPEDGQSLPQLLSCSRAASRCHRCACTWRTCRSWCRSSCRDSASGVSVCSPEAMRLLMRMSSPGDAEQLHLMIGEVVQHRRTGLIRPRTSRRRCTR